jgi:hypothetical protein
LWWSDLFPEIYSLDPPRGRPFGGGGTPRSWGFGGISLHHCSIRPYRTFSRKCAVQQLEIFLKTCGIFQENFSDKKMGAKHGTVTSLLWIQRKSKICYYGSKALVIFFSLP